MTTRLKWLTIGILVLLLASVSAAQTAVRTAPTTTTAPSVTPTPNPAVPPEDELYKFYAQNLRSMFFSGLLTLSSFLLAANTFIVINLKKEVYDSKGYVKYVRGLRQSNTNLTFYGPLKRLSLLLLLNIGIALVASVTQVTFGILLKSKAGAAISIIMAAVAMLLLFVTLMMIGGNLRDWFKHMETEAEEAEARDRADEAAKEIRPVAPPSSP